MALEPRIPNQFILKPMFSEGEFFLKAWDIQAIERARKAIANTVTSSWFCFHVGRNETTEQEQD